MLGEENVAGERVRERNRLVGSGAGEEFPGALPPHAAGEFRPQFRD